MSFVQIGSGSANLDTSFEDGFTNFIKKNKTSRKILIVEANSMHLKNLKKFWKSKKNVKIFNLAIIPDNSSKKKMTFFYSDKDKPNYQLFSSSKSFVLRYFPDGKIRKKDVNCINISSFFEKNKIKKIDYLSIDIEGMDFDVLMNLNLNKFFIKNISFEHLHLSLIQKFIIVFKFLNSGYYFSGMGFDVRKSDWMFTKGYKFKKFITYFLPITPRRIWKEYSFSDQIY
jgi:FkbM family methyltransferase